MSAAIHAAWHEAGHAVARHALELGLTDVEINDDGTGLTHGTGLAVTSRAEIEKHVIYGLAGPLAEARATKTSAFAVFLMGGAIDYVETKRLIMMMGPLDPWFGIYQADARKLLTKHWPLVGRVADALVRERRLSAARLAEVLR